MTPGRDAFLQLVGVLLATGLLRAGCAPRVPPDDALPGTAVDPSALVDSAQALAEDAARRSRPLEAGERLDPNEATEVELDRLPGVGPGLARAIVAARDTLPFASVEDLARVRGIGASTLDKLRSGVAVGRGRGSASRGARVRRARGPGSAPSPGRTRAGLGGSGTTGRGRLDLNAASAAELEALPGIGPVIAERIVREREARRGFRTLDELTEVKGIGPALLERLRGHLQTGSKR